jgi:hypothetical protein
MSGSTGLIVVFGVVGLLLLLTAYRFVTQRRQLSSGREICEVRLVRQRQKLAVTRQVAVSTGGMWCRLLLTLRAEGAYAVRQTPKYFSERRALVVGTPYTLAITDISGKVLHREEDTLGRFVAFLWGEGGGLETPLSERSSMSHEGTVTLLEFLPQQNGSYGITLEIQTRAEDEAPGSSSFWEILEAKLTVMEGVEPLSKIVKYPHQRVEL